MEKSKLCEKIEGRGVGELVNKVIYALERKNDGKIVHRKAQILTVLYALRQECDEKRTDHLYFKELKKKDETLYREILDEVHKANTMWGISI